jgi:hypothetical protein
MPTEAVNAACAAGLQELQVRTADVTIQAQLVQVREVNSCLPAEMQLSSDA